MLAVLVLGPLGWEIDYCASGTEHEFVNKMETLLPLINYPFFLSVGLFLKDWGLSYIYRGGRIPACTFDSYFSLVSESCWFRKCWLSYWFGSPPCSSDLCLSSTIFRSLGILVVTWWEVLEEIIVPGLLAMEGLLVWAEGVTWKWLGKTWYAVLSFFPWNEGSTMMFSFGEDFQS